MTSNHTFQDTQVPNEVFTTMRINPIQFKTQSSLTFQPSILTHFPSLPPSLKANILANLQGSSHSQESNHLESELEYRIPLLRQHLKRLPLAMSNLCQTYPHNWNLQSLTSDASEAVHRPNEVSIRKGMDQENQDLESGTSNSLDLLNEAFPSRIFLTRIETYLSELGQQVQTNTLRLRLSLSYRGQININHGILSNLPSSSSSSSSSLPKVKLDPLPLITSQSIDSDSTPLVKRDSTSSHSESINIVTLLNKTDSRDFYSKAAKRVEANYGLKHKDSQDDGCFDVLLWSKVKRDLEQTSRNSDTKGDGSSDLLTESSIANILLEIPSSRWDSLKPLFSAESSDVRSNQSKGDLTRRLPSSPTTETKAIFLTPRLRDDLGFLPGLMRAELLRLEAIDKVDISLEVLERLFAKGKKVEGEEEGEEVLGKSGSLEKCRLYLCNALRGVWEVELEVE